MSEEVEQPVRRITIIRPKLVDYQRAMIYCDEPNTITEATTKAGKTFSHLWWLFEKAHKPPQVVAADGTLKNKEGANYWWIAPVYIQAKIAFIRMRRVIKAAPGYIINLTDLTVTTPLGSVIWFKSADNPDHLFGDDVEAAVIDEASRVKEEAFFAVRSTLTKTKGSLKIIGNVKGSVNWAYRLARKVEAGQITGWKYFKITCADAVAAGILDESDIESARAVLPTGIFLELYYGIPFVNSANKFAYSFDKNIHAKKCEIDYRFPIYLSFDFNRNPISCVIAQSYGGKIRIPLVLKLENSNIYQLCAVIRTKFNRPGQPAPVFIVNGDASGRASSAMVKDNLNYFRIIKSELNIPLQRMKQLAVNPRIEENQVLVNACLEHIPTEIDPAGAQSLIFDLEFAAMLPDGTLKKTDREDPTQQLDALDGFRYFLNANFRHILKGLPGAVKVRPGEDLIAA
jgi:hypothetical protein